MLATYILRDGSGIMAQAEQLEHPYTYYDRMGMHTAQPGDYCLLYEDRGEPLNVYCSKADFEAAFAPIKQPITGAA